MVDRGGILQLDIYMCWLVPLRPTAVPLNSGCGWGKLESSLSFAFHILKKYDTRKYNICSPTSTEICSVNLGRETTFPTLVAGDVTRHTAQSESVCHGGAMESCCEGPMLWLYS